MQKRIKKKRTTIHDVSRMAGVSAATVSKVLRGVSSVKSRNIARVHEAVATLDYRMDPLATGLRVARRRIIGVIVPDLESPFFGALVTELEKAAELEGYDMIVSSSRESEQRETELVIHMNDWRVAGTILIPVCSENGSGANKLHELDMQAVLVDRVSADNRFDTISANNFEASEKVAEFLVGLGHRHILLHGASRHSKSMSTRVKGFLSRARKLNPNVQVDKILSDDSTTASRRTLIRNYFDSLSTQAKLTAIFSLSQYSTLLVLSELRRKNIRIPEEIVLVGFDDAEWMQTTWPSITAVAQPTVSIAQRAISTLLARIKGNTNEFPAQFLESCEMLVRQSTERENEGSMRTLLRDPIIKRS